jgi:hypothetical protein
VVKSALTDRIRGKGDQNQSLNKGNRASVRCQRMPGSVPREGHLAASCICCDHIEGELLLPGRSDSREDVDRVFVQAKRRRSASSINDPPCNQGYHMGMPKGKTSRFLGPHNVPWRHLALHDRRDTVKCISLVQNHLFP